MKTLFDEVASNAPELAFGFAHSIGYGSPTIYTSGSIHIKSDQFVNTDAPWHIGSITKTLTATMVMRLMELGLLDLDQPIAGYLSAYRDEMHDSWRKLTLRTLLSHSAGLSANPAPSTVKIRDRDNIHQVRHRILIDQWCKPIPRQQGTFHYSNLGYVLAGFILEEIKSKSWEQLVQNYIARPLGLRSLGFGAPTEEGAPWGHRHFFFFKRPVAPEDNYSDNPPWLGPAGTLHMNLADLVKWGQVHLSASRGEMPDFLSAQSCLELHKPVTKHYGLGWVVEEGPTGEKLIWHNGSNMLWYAKLLMLPEKEGVFAAVTNMRQAKYVEHILREAIIRL